MTQPLASPWRRVTSAVRLRVALDRRAALVVEDEHTPVWALDARVFEVERIARLVLVAADGAVIEQRTIVMGRGEEAEFARRVLDTIEWATTMHAALVVELVRDPDPVWAELAGAVRALAASLDEHLCRGAVPREVRLDRRPRMM